MIPISTLAEHTYQVVLTQRAELAGLVGEADWPLVAARLAQLDAAWAATDDERTRRRLAADYRDALAPWPAAYERLRTAAQATTLREAALLGAAAMAEILGDAPGAARLRREALSETRYITGLKPGLPAQSFKLGNVNLTLPNVLAVAAGVLTAIATLTDPAVQWITQAGALVTLIASLAPSFVREIGADDATVFLGLARAAGPDGEAALADIVAATNAARNEGGLALGRLSETQVRASLSVLAQLGSVAKVEGRDDQWRVVEDHGVVGSTTEGT